MLRKDWGMYALLLFIDTAMLAITYFRVEIDHWLQIAFFSKVCFGYLFVKWVYTSWILTIYLNSKETAN